MWSEKEQRELEKMLPQYNTKRSAVLSALYLAQQEKNWLDDDDIKAVADALDLTVTDVHSVIGFYTLFRKEPTGKYIIQFCTDLPCALRGATKFYHELAEQLGLPPEGGTTDDNMFTLEEVVCIAACNNAPCCQINLDYHENLTHEEMSNILSKLRAKSEKESTTQP
ncbi:MAG: hypothetical protein B6242_03985 [Anaerolineaceae bacterium 4572_78]|nr:MAG: hypothetical protein B6242_03985 [Anaerolineaceae bacterium 4572_78]